MTFSVYIPVGPSDEEFYRALDVIDSVAAYNHGLAAVIIIDDATDERPFATALRHILPPAVAIVNKTNPRGGAGDGRTGGLCVADLSAFAIAQQITATSFVSVRATTG
jgi:hypothetical protein